MNQWVVNPEGAGFTQQNRSLTDCFLLKSTWVKLWLEIVLQGVICRDGF